MTFHSLLLSLFTNRADYSSDIQSMRLRHQVLSMIYMNINAAITVTLLDILAWTTIRPPNPFHLTAFTVPLALVSLLCLRCGKIKSSCDTAAIYLYSANLFLSDFGREPLIGIIGLLGVIVLNFFIARSVQVFVKGLVFGILLLGFHIWKALEMIQASSGDAESKSMMIVLTTGIMIFFCISGVLTIQKQTESSLWEMAHINYARSEVLTNEVVQASKAKDVFVSSLSHEIRNPLNSLKGSIDYLLVVVTCPDQLNILRSAKVGCEILHNLANNVLDAAKLQADKMEILYSEASFTEALNRMLMINTENFRSKNITMKMQVDKKLPENLRIDPSRLLQVMMNLVSNALKFTPVGGKITLNINWYPLETDKEKLLLLESVNISKTPLQYLNRREDIEGPEAAETSSMNELNLVDLQKRSKNFESYQTLEFEGIEKADSLIHAFSEHEPWTTNYFNSIYHNNNAGYLKVQVSDSGSGIAEEHIPKLFEMFVQAHQSVNVMHGGTGLGLWICKQLCRKMGGDIKLYSEIQTGTNVVFYVPVNDL